MDRKFWLFHSLIYKAGGIIIVLLPLGPPDPGSNATIQQAVQWFWVPLLKDGHSFHTQNPPLRTDSPKHTGIVGASAASPTLVDKTKICLYIYIFIYLCIYWGERSEPHTCGENGKLSIYIYIYIYMVRTYSVYAFCPICAHRNISTLHTTACSRLGQDYRKAEQWESAQQELENGEEREALLARPRLIDGVLRDSAANGECSVYRAISL